MATTRRQHGDEEAFKISPCKVRGKPMFKLEIGIRGERKRQYFPTLPKAEKAREDAIADREDLGKAWGILTAQEKVALMQRLKELRADGRDIEDIATKPIPALVAPAPSITLRKAIDETILSKRKANRRERYVDGLEQYLNLFARGRETTPVSDFTAEKIEAWFDGRGEKPETRNSNLGRLSAMFDLCWRRRYITENPCERVESASVDSRTPAVLTLAQCAKAIQWARKEHPKFLAWLALALFAGVRPEAEGDNLTWDVIDLKRGRLRIEGDATKVRTHRIVDLNTCPPALAWLRVAEKLKSPLEIPHPTRRRYLRKLRDHLGFEKWPQDVLRHTAASNLLAFHQDAGKVAAFLGNSAGTLLRRYKALVFKEDAEKFMALLPKRGKMKGALK